MRQLPSSPLKSRVLAGPARRAAVILRVRAIAERSLALGLRKELRKTSRALSSAHRASERAKATPRALAAHKSRLTRLYTAHYYNLAKRFALDLPEAMGATAQRPRKKDTRTLPRKEEVPPLRGTVRSEPPNARPASEQRPPADVTDLTEDEILSLVQKLAVAAAITTANGTRSAAERAIARGLKQGASAEEIAGMIEEATGGAVSASRALSIARTAVTAVSGAATVEAARKRSAQTPQRVKVKIWWTAQDARVRPSHVAAHGDAVPLDDSFEVGVSRLRFPGDPQGPPEEVINCRCVLLYEERTVQ